MLQYLYIIVCTCTSNMLPNGL